MLKKKHIYWYCQVIGWSFYIAINFLYQGYKSGSVPGLREYLLYSFMLCSGIGVSHTYRVFLIRLKILELKIPTQLLYIITFSFIKAILFFLLLLLFSSLLGIDMGGLDPVLAGEMVFNFAVIFCLWNVIYFGFQYFQNYKRSEINSLRYLALSREWELNHLKAQLNPHFIFNCMNSIRALIDENPENAKQAVTKLSNMLRNTLLLDKNKEIALKEEMVLVNDYLELEKIRYEERLNYEFQLSPAAAECKIPPFIIQTQVENGIKHGISASSSPGKILVNAGVRDKALEIFVSNTGKLDQKKSSTAVGLKNSLQRLELLYGQTASISIKEEDNQVIVAIRIPLK